MGCSFLGGILDQKPATNVKTLPDNLLCSLRLGFLIRIWPKKGSAMQDFDVNWHHF